MLPVVDADVVGVAMRCWHDSENEDKREQTRHPHHVLISRDISDVSGMGTVLRGKLESVFTENTLPGSIKLGAKVDSVFSSPVDVSGAQVLAVWSGTPASVAAIRHAVLPECALLGIGRLRIVVMAEPTGGVNHPTLYESLGLNVSDATAVVLKTASNFRKYTSNLHHTTVNFLGWFRENRIACAFRVL